MEYEEFAKYYDKFYQNKDYNKEVKFLKCFIDMNDKIIDVGCGTGIHGGILEQDGYDVSGLDLSSEMLQYARERIHGKIYNQDILNLEIEEKYNVVISMFAVINHLKDIYELRMALQNFKNILLPGGLIIIDLHNPTSSGTKIDCYDDLKRIMSWHYDKDTGIERSDITYEIGTNIYHTSHIFKIFTIDEVCMAARELNLDVVNIYDNYILEKEGNMNSKNLQFIIKKKK